MVGAEFATGLRQINDTEVTTFLDRSLLKNPIFMDDQAAQTVGHPKRILPAPLLISLAMGLCQQRGLFDHLVAVVSGCGKKRRGASAAPLREVIFG
jgi:acyl dehydratase